MRRLAPLCLALTLAGCAATLTPDPPAPALPEGAALPPMRAFGPPRPVPPARANADMAVDFVDLTMMLESGTPLPVFTRFDEPVTVALAGVATPVFGTELDRLIGRLRSEAGIDIRRSPAPAAITIEAIRRADLDRVVPQAACFVLPLATTWATFRTDTRAPGLDWTDLRTRKAATVFIPADISPQEIRDCLHEEIAQALGPVNDLFRLEDSIFNDDNMHGVLTGFDMLMLRVAYDPALRNGLTRDEVAARVPAILARLNPPGERVPARGVSPTPPEWQRATVFALSPVQPVTRRRQASLHALDIAQDAGWQDTRLGLSLLTAGRLSTGRDAAFALELSAKHERYFRSRRLDSARREAFRKMAEDSHIRQRELEDNDDLLFDDFLENYFAQNEPS